MHIYPQDYNYNMFATWIQSAVDDGEHCIDIRFNTPVDMHRADTKYVEQTKLANKILGEIGQGIMEHEQVNGSITFVGTTATVYIVAV